jgi:hypothetical protein
MAKAIRSSPVIQAVEQATQFAGGATWQQKQPQTSSASFSWIQISSLR